MKLLLAFLLLMTALPARAQTQIVPTADAILTWDSNTEPDIKGYEMKMGTVSGVYTKTIPVTHISGIPTQTGTFPGLLEGQTYFFSVLAIDQSGNKSAPATEVSRKVSIPPGAPSRFGVIIKFNIEVSIP